MLASNPVTPNSVFGSVIAAFRDWVRKRRMIQQYRHRLDGCDQNEIARIARDELQDLTVAVDAMRHVRAVAPLHVPSLAVADLSIPA